MDEQKKLSQELKYQQSNINMANFISNKTDEEILNQFFIREDTSKQNNVLHKKFDELIETIVLS